MEAFVIGLRGVIVSLLHYLITNDLFVIVTGLFGFDGCVKIFSEYWVSLCFFKLNNEVFV